MRLTWKILVRKLTIATAPEHKEADSDLQDNTSGKQRVTQVVLENTQAVRDTVLNNGINTKSDSKILEELTSRFNQSKAAMDYLRYEEMIDNGQAVELLEEHRVGLDPRSQSAFPTSPQEQRYGLPMAFPSGKVFKDNAAKTYWKGNGPVLEEADYNGETLMLPIVAP